MRLKTINVLTNVVNSAHKVTRSHSKSTPYNNDPVSKVKQYLKANNNILLIKADKANCSIFIEKDSYIEKMNHIITGNNNFEIISNNPTEVFTRRSNNFFKKLLDSKLITNQEYKKLYTSAANIPKLYGTLKIHKQNQPLRPIVSNNNAPTEKLCRFIAAILRNVVGRGEYHIKDTFDFIEKIKHIQVPSDQILASFDIVSLYTNVQNCKVIEVIKKRWSEISPFTNLSVDLFLEAVKITMDANFFQFEQKTYKLNSGQTMGNSTAPFYSNLVLEDLETEIIQKLNLEFFFRYIDDSICCLREDAIQIVQERLHSYDNNLKFTYEIEKERRINFLDTTLIRQHDGNIILDWYRKESQTSRIINFNSQHPLNHKINSVKNFIYRMTKISHEAFWPKNFEKIRAICRDNEYPRALTNKLIRENEYQLRNRRNSEDDTGGKKTTKIFFALDYYPKISHQLKKILSDDIIQIAFKPTNTLGYLFNQKSKTPIHEKANIVYKINCLGSEAEKCPIVYIGTSARKVGLRIREHELSIINKKQNTALACHAFEHRHNFDFKNYKIMYQDQNTFRREFIEMVAIQKYRTQSCNYKIDLEHLSALYELLISLLKF